MKRKLGSCLMMVGTVLMIGALSLFLYNQYEQAKAGQAATEVLSKMQSAIGETAADTDATDESVPVPPAETSPVSAQMKEVEIDGYAYIGYLSIPVLEMELPVMSQWDYSRLKIAPCRFTGTTMDDNLVIAGHNYSRHFGPVRDLVEGDSVIFTDMEGVTTAYVVVAKDIVAPTAVEEITACDFDLTLFTCTYGGQSRVAVFCNRQ